MKTIAATISERGEVPLPPEVLRLLGLGPHDRVQLVVDGHQVRIVPAMRRALPISPHDDRATRAARRRAVLTQVSAAFAHESVEEAERAVAAAIAEVRAETTPPPATE